MKQYSGYLALLLAAFIYSSFGIYIRALSHDLDTYQQIFFRGAIGFFLALIIIFLTKRKFSIANVSRPILFAYTVAFPLVAVFFTFSILMTKITTTLFGYYAAILLGSLLVGKVIFKEKITTDKKIAMVLALLGIYVYTYPLSPDSFNAGLLLALASGLLDAVAMALRKYMANKLERFVLVAIQLFGMAAVSLPFILATTGAAIPAISLTTWGVGLWFGVMIVVINYLLLYAFSNFDLNLGTIVLSSELFFAAVLGYFLLNETITVPEFAGALIILVATGIVGVDYRKHFKKWRGK